MRGVGSEDLKRGCAACREEPFAAAVDVPPAFEMHAFGVVAHEEIGFEIFIRSPRSEAFEMRLTAAVQIGFIDIHAAIRAV